MVIYWYSRGSGDFHDGWDFKVPHGVDKMLLLSTTVQFTKLVMKSVGGTFGLSPVTVTMKSIKKDLIPEAILSVSEGIPSKLVIRSTLTGTHFTLRYY